MIELSKLLLSLSSSFIFLRKGLQLARGTNIFYVYVRRGSRTWNSCSPSFFQQEQEFLFNFLRKKKEAEQEFQ